MLLVDELPVLRSAEARTGFSCVEGASPLPPSELWERRARLRKLDAVSEFMSRSGGLVCPPLPSLALWHLLAHPSENPAFAYVLPRWKAIDTCESISRSISERRWALFGLASSSERGLWACEQQKVKCKLLSRPLSEHDTSLPKRRSHLWHWGENGWTWMKTKWS